MARTVPRTPAEAAVPRLAATVLLLRPSQDGTAAEVLMLLRHAASGFAASQWVFPGGVVDPRDGALDASRYAGLDLPARQAQTGTDARTVISLHVAAAREMFEEAGVLLAHHTDGREVDVDPAVLAEMRTALNDRDREVDFGAFLDRHDLVLDLGGLTHWLRWVTPIQEPRRYDTAFFLAAMPPEANARHDDVETTGTRWITPRAALDDRDFPVIFPTRKTLEWMAEHPTSQALIRHARSQPSIAPTQPHIFVDDDGRYTHICLPGDPEFPTEVYA